MTEAQIEQLIEKAAAAGDSFIFSPTLFEFSNGNTLTVTDENFNAVYAAWVPFRQGFFKPSMAQ